MPFTRLLDTLQWIATGIVLVLFSLGRGAHGVFIGIFLALPVIRLLLSRTYRTRLLDAFHAHVRILKAPQTKPPYRSAFWIVAFPALVYFLANGISISSYDNYGTLLTAASIVREGNGELGEFYRGAETCQNGAPGYYAGCFKGGVRSAYPLGMVLPLVPVYGLARLLGADVGTGDVQWRLSKWVGSLLAALGLVLFYFIARQWFSFAASLTATYFLMLGSTFSTIVSQGPWSHDGVVVGALAILFVEIVLRPQHKYGTALVFGFFLAWMAASRVNAAVVIAPLGLYLVARRGFLFGVLTAVFAVLWYTPLGLYHLKYYDTFLGPQMVMGKVTGYASHPFQNLLGVLFSPGHGLLTYQPWLLLLLFYFLPQTRRANSIDSKAFFFFIAASVFQIGVAAYWPIWWGGTWGSRLLSEIIPFLGFLILPPLEMLYAHRVALVKPVVSSLLLLSLLVHAPAMFFFASLWTYEPFVGDGPFEERVWSWKYPPFLYPLQKQWRPTIKNTIKN